MQKLKFWLIEIGLLFNLGTATCNFYKNGHFVLRKDESYSRDGFCWRCSNKKCKKKVSIHAGSWFEGHNLTLEQIILITYFRVYGVDQEFVKNELGISNQTIVDWYNFSREVCSCILEKDNEKVGGPGIVVEIDESKLSKRKYHRGHHDIMLKDSGFWGHRKGQLEVFCCVFFFFFFFFFFFQKCSRQDIGDSRINIKENINPRTTIISDSQRAYNSLSEEGCKYLRVNHSVNFVDAGLRIPIQLKVPGEFLKSPFPSMVP